MNDFNRIAILLRKFKTHTIQEEEIQELNDWVKKDRNREHFNRMMDGEREISVMRELKKYDRDVAFRKFTHRVHARRRQVGYFTRIAAAIALPIVLGASIFWWVEFPVRQSLPIAKVMSLPPGQKKAILTFDDGTKMALGNNPGEKVVFNKESGFKIDSAGLQYIYQKNVENTVKINELYVPKKGEYNLTLSDGTRVFLNSDSRLIFPVAFGEKQREVVLQGEAYFDVAKDEKRPFIVKTNDLSVQVLGTAFNLKCYSDDNRVETTLVRGSVKVIEGKQEILLEPGEQLCFDRENGKTDKLKVNTALYTSWKDGLFVFERERLEDILNILSRWYDIVVFYQRPEVKSELFTGDLKKYNSIEEHLKMLEMTTDVKFEIRGNTITVK